MAAFRTQARPPAEQPETRAGTASRPSMSSPVSLPSVALPKAGGAIRGIGEKFSANPATGTGAMSVPIATSPGRAGFGPQLSLSYDSGRGNGPFGFGWALSLPAVTRKTDKGLPRYGNSDAFLLSDAEDLVLVAGGVERGGYRVDRFRPRIEGLFARIERWTRLTDGDVHWRSVTRDNVTSVYGEDGESRIADPSAPERVFSWLLCRSHDALGNATVYRYVADDGADVDTGQAHERQRIARVRATSRYLKRIQYGNRVSRLVDATPADPGWMFEVVFDYGDHDPEVPAPAPDRPWPVRSHPFSSYRPGFEVRSYRLCRRVLMFHHFPDEPGVGADCLVRSTSFTYRPGEAVGEFLTEVIQSGHRRVDEGYLTRSLPPLEFEYSQPVLRDEVREIDVLAGEGHQWVDLDGEGVSGVLATQAAGWFYRPNAGEGRFGPARVVSSVPSLASASPRLLDLAGDGQLDLVTPDGFFERREQDWERFVAFTSVPTVDWDDPHVLSVDLDGDGHADLLLTEDEAITWYPSRAEAGFGPAQRVSLPADEDRGPRLVFADAAGSVHLADMSGDGLTDLVRIRNGEVCYWPNLGYGRFGAKVVMDDPPVFDRAELFDSRYLRLADVDGSGVTDLVYLGSGGAQVYLNRSGNAWTGAHVIGGVPRTEVAAVDLLGTGTTCLVWSPEHAASARVRYVDLLGSVKPHLLVRVASNLGAETHVRYAPSTQFYLADKAAGQPWLTRLPFPVQVVERVTTLDRISQNRFVTRYAYHHGHFDGVEREFRGFGMVEQWDTEELTSLGGSVAWLNEDPASHVPPVLTRTWFHTGAQVDYAGEYWREPGLPAEQQQAFSLADTAPPELLRLPDGTAVPHEPTGEEAREACRALKGQLLRQEVYALDGSEKAGVPYQVTETGYTVELLQPRTADRSAVCFTFPRETVTYHYERALYEVDGVLVADPRISHQATLDTDGYGNVRRSVTVGYGRRHPEADADPQLSAWLRDAIRAEQTGPRATLTVSRYTDPINDGEHHRGPLPCESRTYELVNLPATSGRYPYPRLRALADLASDGAHDLPYEDVDATGAEGPDPHRRLIEHVRTLYRRDDLSGPLPLGQAQPLGLLHETYQLALTPGLVSQVYRRTTGGVEEDLVPEPAAVLVAEAGYMSDPDGWWIPSGQPAYAADQFYLSTRFRDPFGAETAVTYDPHHLLILETLDPLGNRTTAEHDYRVLQPWLVMDPNRNQTTVAFDALGLVAGTALAGKPEEGIGDSLAGFEADLPEETVVAQLADPLANPHPVIANATSRMLYDLYAYHRTRDDVRPQPPIVYTLVRETHGSELGSGQRTRLQHRFAYSDGSEREIQRKVQAEPGPLEESGPDLTARWVGSGWTVFNNKGDPVRRYEPFFTDTHRFESEKVAGVSPVLCYDPAGRQVATLAPDHTYTKVVLGPWQELSWDGNDTVLLDPRTDVEVRGYLAAYLETQDGWQTWHARRQAGALGQSERDVAAKTALHAATPVAVYPDSLGRPAFRVVHNRSIQDGQTVDERHPTWFRLDIEGNQRKLVDALGREAARNEYDLLGRQVLASTIDGASRWSLLDTTGNPVRAWDSRGHETRTRYDALRRPTETFLVADGSPPRLVARTGYGEAHPEAAARNLRTRAFEVWDAAGVATNEAYDFKGDLLRNTRRLAVDYRGELDWAAEVPLEPDTYTIETAYDALSRPVTVTAPDGSVLRYTYNEANLLERVEANLRGAETATVFVADLDYDAKGRRTLLVHGNGAHTSYAYDPATFRLTGLRTDRVGDRLQELSYTYDPVGNVTEIRDSAQQAVFFRNQRVAPGAEYTYDAAYRLIEATGREHLGQTGAPVPPGPDDGPRVGVVHPGDGTAMGRYHQRYEYDPAANLVALRHRSTGPDQPGWTRAYEYQEPSLIEGGGFAGNRLSRVRTGELVEPFAYDVHGNLLGMAHLPQLRWDHRGRLRAVAAQVVNGGTPETTWYVYDADGERVRKVGDRQAAAAEIPRRRYERIYLAGFEIHREYGGDGASVVLERETLHVMEGERRLALVETRTTGSDPSPAELVRYQLSDHLGSSTLELDGEAAIISYEEYYPYGSTAYQALDRAELPKRYRFSGKERDEETGFTYHGARYYAPWLGRWVSPDPAGTVDGPNLYAYARCNPVRLHDPDGLLSKENEEFVKAAQKHLDARVDAVEKRIAKIESAVDKQLAKDRAYLEATLRKEYAKEKPSGVTEKEYIEAKIAERRDKELKSRSIDSYKTQLTTLKDLKTFYRTHKFSDDSLLLGNIIVNEAGVENQKSKEAVAYAWLNRTGGTVRAPTGAEISNYQAVGKRLSGKTETARDLFLKQLRESVVAADVRLADTTGAKDPTGGATHWISPAAKIFDVKSGGNTHKRTIGGTTRFVPEWARANDDPEVPRLQTGKDAILKKDYKEITVKDVSGFLFYRGVK